MIAPESSPHSSISSIVPSPDIIKQKIRDYGHLDCDRTCQPDREFKYFPEQCEQSHIDSDAGNPDYTEFYQPREYFFLAE